LEPILCGLIAANRVYCDVDMFVNIMHTFAGGFAPEVALKSVA